jgi:hypothetical protein
MYWTVPLLAIESPSIAVITSRGCRMPSDEPP